MPRGRCPLGLWRVLALGRGAPSPSAALLHWSPSQQPCLGGACAAPCPGSQFSVLGHLKGSSQSDARAPGSGWHRLARGCWGLPPAAPGTQTSWVGSRALCSAAFRVPVSSSWPLRDGGFPGLEMLPWGRGLSLPLTTPVPGGKCTPCLHPTPPILTLSPDTHPHMHSRTHAHHAHPRTPHVPPAVRRLPESGIPGSWPLARQAFPGSPRRCPGPLGVSWPGSTGSCPPSGA